MVLSKSLDENISQKPWWFQCFEKSILKSYTNDSEICERELCQYLRINLAVRRHVGKCCYQIWYVLKNSCCQRFSHPKEIETTHHSNFKADPYKHSHAIIFAQSSFYFICNFFENLSLIIHSSTLAWLSPIHDIDRKKLEKNCLCFSHFLFRKLSYTSGELLQAKSVRKFIEFFTSLRNFLKVLVPLKVMYLQRRGIWVSSMLGTII